MLGLIRRYLDAGIMANGVVVERHEGTPQGVPLSPLLALKLRINESKSAVARPWDRKFLGYSFWVAKGRSAFRGLPREPQLTEPPDADPHVRQPLPD